MRIPKSLLAIVLAVMLVGCEQKPTLVAPPAPPFPEAVLSFPEVVPSIPSDAIKADHSKLQIDVSEPPATLVALEVSESVWPVTGSNDFIEKFCPYAQLTANALNVHPAPILGQAALETGWGKHRPGTGFNMFGIKAGKSWKGRRTMAMTTEFYNGKRVRVPQPFRDYDSLAHAWWDYHKIIKNNKRYGKALAAGRDWKAYIQGVKDGGYATDPLYVQKVVGLINKNNLVGRCPP